MTPKDETSPRIIAVQDLWYRILIAILGSLFLIFGVSAFMAAVFVPPLPVGNALYAIPWILMWLAPLLAIPRNEIVYSVFRRISHSGILKLVYFGNKVGYTVIALGISFFFIGFLFNNATLVLISLGLFFTFAPIVFIFSDTLTYAGGIRLLFELLFLNIHNFKKRQQYLRAISKKIEDILKIGNIKLPRYEFIYHCNVEMLKGTYIQRALRNTEAWMIGEKALDFESIKDIYPEDKLEPWKKIPFSRQVTENPPGIIKLIVSLVVGSVLIASNPDRLVDILKMLSGLLGFH